MPTCPPHSDPSNTNRVFVAAMGTQFSTGPDRGLYRSQDGGHTWNALPHISGNLAVLAVDPINASSVYLSLSYPTELYRLSQDSKGWTSLTPQA